MSVQLQFTLWLLDDSGSLDRSGRPACHPLLGVGPLSGGYISKVILHPNRDLSYHFLSCPILITPILSCSTISDSVQIPATVMSATKDVTKDHALSHSSSDQQISKSV